MNLLKINQNKKLDVIKVYKQYKNNINVKNKDPKIKYNFILNEIIKLIPLFMLFYNAKIMKILKFARYYNIGSLFLINLIKMQGVLDFRINIYSIKPRKAKSFRELIVLNRNLFNKLITNPKRTNQKTFFGKVLITKIKLKQFYNTSITKLRKLWLSTKKKRIHTIFNFIKNLEFTLKMIIYRLGIVKTIKEAQKFIKKKNLILNNKYQINPNYLIKSKNTIIKFNPKIKKELYSILINKLQNFQLYQKNLNEVSEFNIYNLSFIFFKKELVNFIPPPLKKLTKPTTSVVKKYLFPKIMNKRQAKPYREPDRKNKGIESYIIAKP